jgi:hypothetical protein
VELAGKEHYSIEVHIGEFHLKTDPAKQVLPGYNRWSDRLEEVYNAKKEKVCDWKGVKTDDQMKERSVFHLPYSDV